MKYLLILGFVFTPGCFYVEGNSYLIEKGQTHKFLNMSFCEKEALSTYEDGTRKYANFECRFYLNNYLLDSKSYSISER